MTDLVETFNTTLIRFLSDLDRYYPNDKCAKFVELLKGGQLDMQRVAFRYYKYLEEHKELITSKDSSLFEKPLYLLPEINMSEYWPNLTSNQQKKMFIYINILFVTSETLLTANKKKEADIDVIAGVGPTDNNYSVSDVYSGPMVMPGEEESNNAGPGLESVSKMLGVDKMLNLQELSEHLNSMDPEALEQTFGSIESLMGSKFDDAQKQTFASMFEHIKEGLTSEDLSSGSSIENLFKIANKVSEKMRPELKKSGVNINDMITQMQEGNPMFNNMLNMMNGTGNVQEMMQNMGGSSNVQEMMQNMGVNPASINSTNVNPEEIAKYATISTIAKCDAEFK
jgi:hypothetical protein